MQINGIPKINDIAKLELGNDTSINSRCYIQCVGGVKIEDRVTLLYGACIFTSGLLTSEYNKNAVSVLEII